MKKKTALLLTAATLATLSYSLVSAEDLPSVLGDAAATPASTPATTSAPAQTEATPVPTLTSASPAADSKGFTDFKDVSTDHPYYNAIIVGRYQGLLQGYSDNTFRPDQPLNRVEALKLIFEAADLPLTNGIAPAKFKDTEDGSWYDGYLNKAVYLEVVTGYDDNTFRPNNSVNLVEFLKMLEVAQKVDLSNVNLPQIPYTDVMPGSWYSKYVNFAKINDLIQADTDNKIHPDQALTRGRAADIVYRFRNWKSRQPATSPTPAPSTPGSTSSNSNVVAVKDFALYVSTGYKFAIQYPKLWFYSTIDNTDPTAIRTYGFGPKDLATNPPVVTLELLPDDKNFVSNQVYNTFAYLRADGADGSIILSAKINGSSRVYRLTGASAQEANMLNMLASLTANVDGLSSYNPAADATTPADATPAPAADATPAP